MEDYLSRGNRTESRCRHAWDALQRMADAEKSGDTRFDMHFIRFWEATYRGRVEHFVNRYLGGS